MPGVPFNRDSYADIGDKYDSHRCFRLLTTSLGRAQFASLLSRPLEQPKYTPPSLYTVDDISRALTPASFN